MVEEVVVENQLMNERSWMQNQALEVVVEVLRYQIQAWLQEVVGEVERCWRTQATDEVLAYYPCLNQEEVVGR